MYTQIILIFKVCLVFPQVNIYQRNIGIKKYLIILDFKKHAVFVAFSSSNAVVDLLQHRGQILCQWNDPSTQLIIADNNTNIYQYLIYMYSLFTINKELTTILLVRHLVLFVTW